VCWVCGNLATTLPPWVRALARRVCDFWVGRVDGCFMAKSSTERRGGVKTPSRLLRDIFPNSYNRNRGSIACLSFGKTCVFLQNGREGKGLSPNRPLSLWERGKG
jgi:hypothetical protein